VLKLFILWIWFWKINVKKFADCCLLMLFLLILLIFHLLLFFSFADCWLLFLKNEIIDKLESGLCNGTPTFVGDLHLGICTIGDFGDTRLGIRKKCIWGLENTHLGICTIGDLEKNTFGDFKKLQTFGDGKIHLGIYI
jgi:hypothetical protein